MKVTKSFFIICFALLATFAQAQHVDSFIKFDGVESPSKVIDIRDLLPTNEAVDIFLQLSNGAHLPDIGIRKAIDKSSPKIARAQVNNQAVPRVEIRQRHSDGYYRYTLKNVIVTSYSTNSSQNVPMEQFSLNFEEIKVTYHRSGSPNGRIIYSWKVEEGVN